MRNSSIAVFTTLKTTIPANAFDRTVKHATFGRPLAPLITRVQSLSESHLGGHTVVLPGYKLKKNDIAMTGTSSLEAVPDDTSMITSDMVQIDVVDAFHEFLIDIEYCEGSFVLPDPVILIDVEWIWVALPAIALGMILV
jgi:hypothetical protein